MLILTVIVLIWGILLVRSCVAEYKYYQSVKVFEPDIWEKLGSPKYLNIPLVFVSTKGLYLLSRVTNSSVCELARQHRKAGVQFLSFVILVLIASIIYFKIA